MDTPQQSNDRGYVDFYQSRTYAERIPRIQLPVHDWPTLGRNDTHLPPIRGSELPHEVMVSDSNEFEPAYTAVMPQKPNYPTIIGPTEICSSSEGWITPPQSSHAIGQGLYYSSYPESTTDSRSSTPFPWPQPIHAADAFGPGSFDETMVPTSGSFSSHDSMYIRRSSDSYQGDRDGHMYRSTYPESPLQQSMSFDRDRRHVVVTTSQYDQHRMVRTPPGVKSMRKGRVEAGVAKRKSKAIKNDLGYIHAPDGSHIPVKLQGDFKKDSSGRWTGVGGDSQKHKCEMMRGDESCSRTFKRIEHLRRHMKTHTQEQPFACDFMTEKFEDSQFRSERCGKLFQRNDNCVAHFKTHVSQDKNGLYFPGFHVPKDRIESASNDYLVELANSFESRIHSDDRKKGSRNPRVTWEEFLHRIKSIKSAEESAKIIASVFKSCLKDDVKIKYGGER